MPERNPRINRIVFKDAGTIGIFIVILILLALFIFLIVTGREKHSTGIFVLAAFAIGVLLARLKNS